VKPTNTLAILLASTCVAAGAQEELPPIEAEQVAPGVHVLYGAGGNIGVSSGPHGVFLVDDQYAPMTPKIAEALAKLSPHPPRFVLNTHWHGDHTGGNENLANQGTLVVAHDNVRARMGSEQFSKMFDRTTPPAPGKALPVVTFSDKVSFYMNGEEIRGTHVAAAHTDGDTYIRFRNANVLHAGDLLFAGMYPFIDIDSGGTVDGLIAAVDRMLAEIDGQTRVIPGHGKVTDRAGLAAYRELLATTSGRVRDLVRQGRTLDEVLAAKPNADLDAAMSWSFITAERFLQILYRDATEVARARNP